MNTEKISAAQASMLLTCCLLGTSVIVNPAAISGNDAWLSALVSWAGGYLILLLVATVAELHPGKSFVQILTACIGRRAGKIIGFIYGLIFIRFAGVVLHIFSYYIISAEYPETPILFIDICFMIVIAYAVRIGLETLGRMSEIFLPIFAAIVATTIFSFFSSFHADAFMPFLKDGIMPPIMSGLQGAILPFAESILALSIFQNVRNKSPYKVANTTALLTGGFFFIFTARNIMCAGVNMSGRNIFPASLVFRLMPGIDIYPLLDFDVIVTGILKSALFLYAAVKILGEVFSLAEPKILVLPTAALSISFAQLTVSSIYQDLQDADAVTVAYIPMYLIPLAVLLIISMVKAENQRKASAQKLNSG